MTQGLGDGAFRSEGFLGRGREMTYGGALSFLRRKYTRDIAGADVVVSGIPFDCATTFRPGARLGPQSVRAASVQLAELLSFPFDAVDGSHRRHRNVPQCGICRITARKGAVL